MKFNCVINEMCDFCGEEKPIITVVNGTVYICKDCAKLINQKCSRHILDVKDKAKREVRND